MNVEIRTELANHKYLLRIEYVNHYFVYSA